MRPGGPVPLPDVPASIGGEWRSIGKTQPLTGEDLSAPGALEAAAEKRSFRGEIIVMVANEGGAILAANAVANLRSVGIEHYLIVTNEPKSCELLMNGPWGITCGYTSYLKNHERLKDYQLLNEEEPLRSGSGGSGFTSSTGSFSWGTTRCTSTPTCRSGLTRIRC